MKTIEQTAIYNENCVMAGRPVPQRVLDQNEDPANGGDWTWYDLSEQAAICEEARGGFGRRVAATIRKMI